MASPSPKMKLAPSHHVAIISVARLANLHRLLKLAARVPALSRRSFVHELNGKHEQQQALGGGYSVWHERGLRFEYTVPSRICGADGSMPLSAILSLADEVTTWASAAADPRKRPGASISLDATLTEQGRAPRAGDTLHFESRIQKIGQSVGFIACEVNDAASGRNIARVGHTKYLAMGAVWNALMGPWMFPLTSSLVGALPERPPPSLDLDDAAAYERLVAPLSSETSAANDGSSARSSSRHKVLEEHLQEVGVLFGGVHAIWHERAAAAAAAALQPERSLQCCALRVSYLGGGGLGDELEAQATSTPRWRGAGATASSRLVRASSGSLRSEAQLEFSEVD